MEKNEEIVIVGAGIAGLATALGLHRLGLRSLVLESSESLRSSGHGIVLSANAWRALDAVGVGYSIRHQHPQLKAFQLNGMNNGVYIPNATVLLQGEDCRVRREIRCVARKTLLESLEKELPPGTLRFSSKVVSIQESGYFKLLHLADGSIVKAKTLIGCDGVNSVVAKWLGLPPTVSNERFAIRALAEFPDGHGLQHMISQYNGWGIRYGCVPCDDTKVYWFLTFPSSAETKLVEEELKKNPPKIKQFVVDKLDCLPEQVKLMLQNTEMDNLSLSILRVRLPLDILLRSIQKGNVCVAGDALHPMTPDIGQGACCSLEDAVVLARCLGKALNKSTDNDNNGVIKALAKYAKDRQWRSFLTATTSFLTGKLQQSNGLVIGFLREKFLSSFFMNMQLKISDFDCGSLQCA